MVKMILKINIVKISIIESDNALHLKDTIVYRRSIIRMKSNKDNILEQILMNENKIIKVSEIIYQKDHCLYA